MRSLFYPYWCSWGDILSKVAFVICLFIFQDALSPFEWRKTLYLESIFIFFSPIPLCCAVSNSQVHRVTKQCVCSGLSWWCELLEVRTNIYLVENDERLCRVLSPSKGWESAYFGKSWGTSSYHEEPQNDWVQCDMLLDLALLGLNTVLQFNSFENRYGCI